VHKLRAKLARAVPGCGFIHTHFGFGYRFQPEYSADSVGKHRYPAGFAGRHRPPLPLHEGAQQRQQDGYE
jgi:hypothetical protein